MIGVIIGSRKMGINPDNVATPIAASLGDLITLALLSGISWGLYKELGEEQQKAICVSVVLPCAAVSLSRFTLYPLVGMDRMLGLEAVSVSETQSELVRGGGECSSCLGAAASPGSDLHASFSPGKVLRERLSLSMCQGPSCG